jgi:hypothetical protein
MLIARDDIRWHKVPYSVRQPRLRELHRYLALTNILSIYSPEITL